MLSSILNNFKAFILSSFYMNIDYNWKKLIVIGDIIMTKELVGVYYA